MIYEIDAKNKPLGRLASEIAHLLQDKNSPKYEQRLPGENRVLVINVHEIKVTGKKADQKIYYRHTGYMGHLKEKTFKQAFAKPAWVLRHAVRGMLPKNFLIDRRMKRLEIK
ncbi:MAG TPA: 50S ribosomal protein L13 [Candidatus Paceibacterota bacterium]